MYKLLAFALFFHGFLQAQPLSLISFNLESGDADIEFLSDQISAIEKPVDVWLFQEALPRWFDQLENAVKKQSNSEVVAIMGNTGGADRLVTVLVSKRFHLVEVQELDHINIGNRVRAPLSVKISSGDREMILVNNHLYRSSADGRWRQSQMLHQWAAEQNVPVVIN